MKHNSWSYGYIVTNYSVATNASYVLYLPTELDNPYGG